jgi:hypothetical protein
MTTPDELMPQDFIKDFEHAITLCGLEYATKERNDGVVIRIRFGRATSDSVHGNYDTMTPLFEGACIREAVSWLLEFAELTKQCIAHDAEEANRRTLRQCAKCSSILEGIEKQRYLDNSDKDLLKRLYTKHIIQEKGLTHEH